MDDNQNFSPNNDAPQFQPPPTPPTQPQYQASPPPPQQQPQQQYQQPQYQQPQYHPPQQQFQQQYQALPPDTSVMSLKDWLITLIVFAIPCIGIVMMFVWAFGDGNVNRKNFAKAYLIFMAIAVVLSLLFYFIFAVAIMSSMSNFGSYSSYNY